MMFAIYNDFPDLENGLPKFHDFPWPGGTVQNILWPLLYSFSGGGGSTPQPTGFYTAGLRLADWKFRAVSFRFARDELQSTDWLLCHWSLALNAAHTGQTIFGRRQLWIYEPASNSKLTLLSAISALYSLHCALSLAAQCIAIGSVCGIVCVCVCVGLLPR